MFAVSRCVYVDMNSDVLIGHGMHVADIDGIVYRIGGQITFVAEVGKKALIKTVTKQSVIPSASMVKDLVQHLTHVPVLIHMRVHYVMELRHVHT